MHSIVHVKRLASGVGCLAPWAGCAHSIDNAVHVDGIRTVLAGRPHWVGPGALATRRWTIERAFYESRGYLPAWVDGNATTPQWKDLISQLRLSVRHGLGPAGGADGFEQLREASQSRLRGTAFPVDVIPEHDARLTYAYLRYAADFLGWTHDPRDVHPAWLSSPRREDLSARLTDAVSKDRVRATLKSATPWPPAGSGSSR